MDLTSSETQGRSVGSGEKAGRKFSSTGERAPGYRLSSNYFQKFKRMPAPDWAQKMLCIIVPNRRTVSPEFFFVSSYTTAIVLPHLPGSFTKLVRARETLKENCFVEDVKEVELRSRLVIFLDTVVHLADY